MILDKLKIIWKSGKFPNSWILEGGELIYQQLLKFLREEIDQNIASSPDFFLVKKSNQYSIKTIVIEQIRELQQWLYKTSINSKFAVIYDANLMNINASNCCLKMLEDTPQNSYIFLLTINYYSLIPTIRSRCRLLYSNIDRDNLETYEVLLGALIKKDVNLITNKLKNNHDTWLDFQSSVVLFLNKLLKFYCNSIFLSEIELKAVKILPQCSFEYLILKTEKLMKMLKDAYLYNLDYQHVAILVFNVLLI